MFPHRLFNFRKSPTICFSISKVSITWGEYTDIWKENRVRINFKVKAGLNELDLLRVSSYCMQQVTANLSSGNHPIEWRVHTYTSCAAFAPPNGLQEQKMHQNTICQCTLWYSTSCMGQWILWMDLWWLALSSIEWWISSMTVLMLVIG